MSKIRQKNNTKLGYIVYGQVQRKNEQESLNISPLKMTFFKMQSKSYHVQKIAHKTVQTTLTRNLKYISHLKERLDTGPLLNLLLGHALGDHPWVSIDAGDESVAKGFVRGSIIVGLNNDGLASGKSTGQDKDNLALFHNLTHDFRFFSFVLCCYTKDIRGEKEV